MRKRCHLQQPFGGTAVLAPLLVPLLLVLLASCRPPAVQCRDGSPRYADPQLLVGNELVYFQAEDAESFYALRVDTGAVQWQAVAWFSVIRQVQDVLYLERVRFLFLRDGLCGIEHAARIGVESAHQGRFLL